MRKWLGSNPYYTISIHSMSLQLAERYWIRPRGEISLCFIILGKADKQLIVKNFRILWSFSVIMVHFLEYGSRNLCDSHALLPAPSSRKFATEMLVEQFLGLQYDYCKILITVSWVNPLLSLHFLNLLKCVIVIWNLLILMLFNTALSTLSFLL